jgi:hypothetical protein
MHGHPASGPPVDPADMRVPTGPAPGARTEIDRLRRWKAEAMAVLGDWEKVYEALGRPGQLGESKAKASEAEVLRLLARGRHRRH